MKNESVHVMGNRAAAESDRTPRRLQSDTSKEKGEGFMKYI